jgi:hypothetical protein
VVSISTTRDTPSAFGLSHFVAGAADEVGAADVGAGAGAFWAQAVAAADIEIARAVAKALRIMFSMRGSRCPYS